MYPLSATSLLFYYILTFFYVKGQCSNCKSEINTAARASNVRFAEIDSLLRLMAFANITEENIQ